LSWVSSTESIAIKDGMTVKCTIVFQIYFEVQIWTYLLPMGFLPLKYLRAAGHWWSMLNQASVTTSLSFF